MKRRILISIIVFGVIIIFMFGIPIIINECYKLGGYITMWNAADVLG